MRYFEISPEMSHCLPKNKVVIARLPMVFGPQSPRVKEIRQHINEHTAVEVFPNIINH